MVATLHGTLSPLPKLKGLVILHRPFFITKELEMVDKDSPVVKWWQRQIRKQKKH